MRGKRCKALRGLSRGSGMGDAGYRAIKRGYARMGAADLAHLYKLCREWWAAKGVYSCAKSAND